MSANKPGRIAPLHEFKENMEQYIAELKKEQQPLILTQNGSKAAVLLDHELFLRMVEQIEFLKKVAQGMEDYDVGKVFSLQETFESIDKMLDA